MTKLTKIRTAQLMGSLALMGGGMLPVLGNSKPVKNICTECECKLPPGRAGRKCKECLLMEGEKMNAKEFAKLLDGRQYRNEITGDECEQAKENGLLVVFGASDDIAMLNGFECDEVGCYEGGSFRVDKEGLQPSWPEGEEMDYGDAKEFFSRELQPCILIHAIWHDIGPTSWTYETLGEWFPFNIMEGDEVYCVGIVIDMKNYNWIE